jgi:cell filamentation protein
MSRDRYAVDDSREGAFQPGSRGRVLANRLGLVRVRDVQQAESEALLALLTALLVEVTDDQRVTTGDLCAWHRRWLGALYPWPVTIGRSISARAVSSSPLRTWFPA